MMLAPQSQQYSWVQVFKEPTDYLVNTDRMFVLVCVDLKRVSLYSGR